MRIAHSSMRSAPAIAAVVAPIEGANWIRSAPIGLDGTREAPRPPNWIRPPPGSAWDQQVRSEDPQKPDVSRRKGRRCPPASQAALRKSKPGSKSNEDPAYGFANASLSASFRGGLLQIILSAAVDGRGTSSTMTFLWLLPGRLGRVVLFRLSRQRKSRSSPRKRGPSCWIPAFAGMSELRSLTSRWPRPRRPLR